MPTIPGNVDPYMHSVSLILRWEDYFHCTLAKGENKKKWVDTALDKEKNFNMQDA